MFKNSIVKLFVWLLKKSSLSIQQKGMLANAIIDKLHALPLRDIIQKNPQDGSLIINGKTIDREQANILRESAKRDLVSKSLAIVRDQVLFEALYFTATKCVGYDEIYASKMSVWWAQQEQRHLLTLASYGESEE